MAGKLIRVLVDGWNRIEPAESLDEASSAVRFRGLEFVEDGEVIAAIPSSFVIEYGVNGGSRDSQSTKIEFIAPVQFVFLGKDGKELT